MHYVGVDLHRQVISLCVVVQSESGRSVAKRRNVRCADTSGLREFFDGLRPFAVVVEATATYEWFVQLVEPLAERVVLAHPKKLRIIAESTRKTDKLDAQVLAEFLALGMIPQAHRPTPRQRNHRLLVRHRHFTQRKVTGVKNRIRRILANHNLEINHLFNEHGREHLAQVALPDEDRFVVDQMLLTLTHLEQQRAAADKRLARFAAKGSPAEQEARRVLESIPYVGPITVDVVLSELGDVQRFRSQKQVVAYAGLAPGLRESAGHRKRLGITKEGSRMLRWALVETAWRLVGHSRRWGFAYEKLKLRCGAKKAIVAVARRILGVMVSMLRSGQRYSLATEILT